jgi:hypothetical protein
VYAGPNGSGKSWTAVYDTIPSLDYGRTVLSTTPLYLPGTDQLHPAYVKLTSYQQIMEAEHCDILLDEATSLFSAHETSSVPVQVRTRLLQLRKADVVVRITAPSFQLVDKTIRRVAQAVTICSGHASIKHKAAAGELPSMWFSQRAFFVRTFDAQMLDDFDNKTVTDELSMPRPMTSALYWRPGGLAESYYGTGEPVSTFGWADASGMCLVCEGRRTLRKCVCDDHDQVPDQVSALQVQPKVRGNGNGPTLTPLPF